MKNFISDNLVNITGGLVGSAAGYVYWYCIGSVGDYCPIVSSLMVNILWWGSAFTLISNIFKLNKNTDIR